MHPAENICRSENIQDDEATRHVHTWQYHNAENSVQSDRSQYNINWFCNNESPGASRGESVNCLDTSVSFAML